jgi:hypothetical protein
MVISCDTPYLTRLAADFKDIGIYNDTPDIRTVAQLEVLLTATGKIGDPLVAARKILEESVIRTDLGKAVVTLCKDSAVRFGGTIVAPSCTKSLLYYQVCAEAEPNVIASLDSASIKTERSPLIITDQATPIAVAKAKGETTIFALADHKKSGLIANTFTAHRRLLHIKQDLARVSGVYTIDVSELGEPFVAPRRFSTYAIPPQERGSLKDTTEAYSICPDALYMASNDVCTLVNSVLELPKIPISVDEFGTLAIK